MTKGYIVINFMVSFDCELAWGLYNRKNYDYIYQNVAYSNLALDSLLAIHRKHSVPATWAFVGISLIWPIPGGDISYFNDEIYKNNSEDLKNQFLQIQKKKSLVSFDESTINQLLAAEHQEIASHTYFHTFFDEVINRPATLAHDFERFKSISTTLGFKAVSMIFPRNIFFNDKRLTDLLTTYGVRCVRVNPDNALYRGLSYKPPGRIIKLARALDFYIPLNEMFNLIKDKRCYGSHISNEIRFSIASLFFRGSVNAVMDSLAFTRFKVMCWLHIKFNQDIHIWSHPHNFGRKMGQSLSLYERYIKHIKRLESKGYLRLIPMSEL